MWKFYWQSVKSNVSVILYTKTTKVKPHAGQVKYCKSKQIKLDLSANQNREKVSQFMVRWVRSFCQRPDACAVLAMFIISQKCKWNNNHKICCGYSCLLHEQEPAFGAEDSSEPASSPARYWSWSFELRPPFFMVFRRSLQRILCFIFNDMLTLEAYRITLHLSQWLSP